MMAVTKKKQPPRASAKKVSRKTTAPRAAVRSPSTKIARDLIVQAANDISFVHPAIPTRIDVKSDRFHVELDILDRETGTPCTLALIDDLPPLLADREQALDWIYARVRDAWVHELNEALFVDGTRRRDLHNDRGHTIPPPDEATRSALAAFKMQLAAFLMGGRIV